MAHLLSQGFRVTPLVQWRFLANRVAHEIHFVIACLCQKGVELSLYSCIIDSENIHALLANLWAVIMYFYTSIHAILEL